jgi:hypothetical protein
MRLTGADVTTTTTDRGKTAPELRREVDRLLRQARAKALAAAELLIDANKISERADALQQLAEITERGAR